MQKLLPLALAMSLPITLLSACTESSALVCPPDESVAEDLEATPRADTNLELLALDAQPFGRLTVEQAMYDRVVRDVAAARALEPELVDVTYRPQNDGRSLRFSPGADNIRAWKNGNYHDLDCFLAAYGGEIVGAMDHTFTPKRGDELLHVRFHGIYDLNRVMTQISSAPHMNFIVVGQFDPDGGELVIPDGPSICLSANDTTWHYVFIDTDGPCAGECTATTDYYVTSQPNGEVVLREVFVESTTAPLPAFMTSFRSSECGTKHPFPPRFPPSP